MIQIRHSLNFLLLVSLVWAASGCNFMDKDSGAITQGSGTPTLQLGPTASTNSAVMNNQIPGVGSSLVPTTDAIVGRIENGVSGNAVHTAGNFKNALTQLTNNLPQVTNPLNATGYDQIPLLVLAACADVSPSKYSVNTGQSVQTNMANLVAAGMKMLDQHLGGLASQGPFAAQLSSVFTSLINSDVANGDTTATTFISVCLAANTYGVGMRGF